MIDLKNKKNKNDKKIKNDQKIKLFKNIAPVAQLPL